MTKRDKKGRFCKDEIAITGDSGEFKIKIPLSEYIPFFFILICFLATALPWMFAAPKLLKKLMKHIGISVIEAVLNKNETIIVTKTENEGAGGTGTGLGGSGGGG